MKHVELKCVLLISGIEYSVNLVTIAKFVNALTNGTIIAHSLT